MDKVLTERLNNINEFTEYNNIEPLVKEYNGYLKCGYSEKFAIEIMEIKYVPRIPKFGMSDQV